MNTEKETVFTGEVEEAEDVIVEEKKSKTKAKLKKVAAIATGALVAGIAMFVGCKIASNIGSSDPEMLPEGDLESSDDIPEIQDHDEPSEIEE